MIIANWKMNMTLADAQVFLAQFHPLHDCVLCVPYTLLSFFSQHKQPHVHIGAQNLFYEQKGAYTGEISSQMIKEFAEYVIIGHSERRLYFHETEEIVHKKLYAALSVGLIPIFCINDLTQLCSLHDLSFDTLYIAYEPVASIGTGHAADPDEINHLLKKIKEQVTHNYSVKSLSLLYGGSVTVQNASMYLKQSEVNGLLVGGASLKPLEFQKIIQEQ